MHSIDEKRVYDTREGATTAYIASNDGVVGVSLSGDAVGEFSLLERSPARDVAAGVDAVAVAAETDVLVGRLEAADEPANEATIDFGPTGFGPAVAIGIRDGILVVADGEGRVSTRPIDGEDDDWTRLTYEGDRVPSAVRAVEGDLLATDAGIFREWQGTLVHAGLEDVRDVSTGGVPLAATADGLYKLGNGWMCVLEPSVELVAADPSNEPGSLARAHAVADGSVWTSPDGSDRPGTDSAGEQTAWGRVPCPTDDPPVGIAYGETVYAVTSEGTVLARALASGDEGIDRWRTQSLGVRGVTGIAIPAPAGGRP